MGYLSSPMGQIFKERVVNLLPLRVLKVTVLTDLFAVNNFWVFWDDICSRARLMGKKRPVISSGFSSEYRLCGQIIPRLDYLFDSSIQYLDRLGWGLGDEKVPQGYRTRF